MATDPQVGANQVHMHAPGAAECGALARHVVRGRVAGTDQPLREACIEGTLTL